MADSYCDLEIRILERQEAGYPVELTLNHEQEFPRGFLDALILRWRPGADPAEDGKFLFDQLFADPKLKLAWAEARSAQPLRAIRLRIDAAAPELHAIPWELLRDVRDDHTAQDLAATATTPFSRYLAGTWQPGAPILKRPIKILVWIPNPTNLQENGLAPFDITYEWNNIQAAVAELVANQTIELTQISATQPCTLAALEAELKKGYHILHFVGHGGYANGDALIVMVNAANQVEFVSDKDFSEMLARQLAELTRQSDDKLRLVYLDSCATAKRDTVDALRGFAPTLVKAGVPAVIAMQDNIAVSTSQTFSHTFYRQLLRHGQVDLACNEARSAVLTAKLPGAAIPVLFMRLRSGLLLGKQGRISPSRQATFWPFLLKNIAWGQCTPFLGPRVNTGLLSASNDIAEKLADEYGYPLADRQNLARVAQFVALLDPDLLRKEYLQLLQRSLFQYLGIQPTEEEKKRFRNSSLSETISALDWANKVLTVQENEIHHLLAALKLPLYMTTNTDNFMAEALNQQAMTQARRAGLRWQFQAGSPQYVLSPAPSQSQPVVFHLNGHDGDPEQARNLVLSESDYLAHYLRIARDQDFVMPMNVTELLARNTFVLLGYDIDDWEFRLVVQGLLAPIAQADSSQKMHIGVQLDMSLAPNADKISDYLGRLLNKFKIDIYWGTPQQFVTELHSRWQAYLEQNDDW